MPKIINLKSFKTVAAPLFILATLLTNGVAWGQAKNAMDTWVPVYFVRNGMQKSENVKLVEALWSPAYPEWNGKNTVMGNPVYNVHTGQMWQPPIANIVTDQGFPCGTNNITAAEINAYWDAQYCVGLYGGAERIEEPTWRCNCHGHSTDLGYWVNDVGVVVGNDWELCNTEDRVVAGCLRGNFAHTIKITNVYRHPGFGEISSLWQILETTEKMGCAGTYRYSFYFPGGLPLNPMSTYKRKY